MLIVPAKSFNINWSCLSVAGIRVERHQCFTLQLLDEVAMLISLFMPLKLVFLHAVATQIDLIHFVDRHPSSSEK